MTEKKLNIIYLGCSGFPVGLAEIERQKLISKSLVNAGAMVTIINRKGIHYDTVIPAHGTYEGIKYIYTSGSASRPPHFFNRNYSKFIGIINELKYIYSESGKNKIDAAIISTMSFSLILYYRLISLIFGFKTILNYVEFSSAIKMRLKFTINNYFFDRFAVRLSDFVIPISDYLINYIKQISPDKPILKIPAICDFDKFKVAKISPVHPYFLFCGVVHYWEVIVFVIQSFSRINNNEYYLYLIINGNSKSKQKIFEAIEQSPKKLLIKTFSKLDYNELVNYYINSTGLLIPLRPTIQDTARFPHKLAEYTASGNPVITTKCGEIPKYFTDLKNALIADSYNEGEYSEKMQFVIDNPEQAKMIGKQGFDTGLEYFNYLTYGPKIIAMIK